MIFWVTKLKHAFVIFFTAVLVGCASIPAGVEPSPNDPWEPFNRSVFEFNEGLDAYLLKPVVAGYRFVLPEFVREGIYNFFSNYNDVYTALNNLLQGKPADSFDRMRYPTRITGNEVQHECCQKKSVSRNHFRSVRGLWAEVFRQEVYLRRVR